MSFLCDRVHLRTHSRPLYALADSQDDLLKFHNFNLVCFVHRVTMSSTFFLVADSQYFTVAHKKLTAHLGSQTLYLIVDLGWCLVFTSSLECHVCSACWTCKYSWFSISFTRLRNKNTSSFILWHFEYFLWCFNVKEESSVN